MTKLRIFAIVILILTLAACVPAAQPTAQPAAPQAAAAQPAGAQPPASVEGGTVTRALTSEPSSLDPHGPAGSGQNVILPFLFDTLVYRDTDNSYKPYLAQSWEFSADGKAVTFKLRTDVKFHDGTPMDAAAVVFSFQRFMEKGMSNPSATGLADIAKVEAVDPQTVRFTLKEPSSIFLGTISMPYAGILSPTAVKTEGDEFGQKPVGTGAFKLEKWEPGVAVTLVRNPDYKWGPPAVENKAAPHIERAVFKVIPDASTQLAALQTGDVDMIFVNQPGQVQTLKADKNMQVIETTLNSLVYLGFNCKQAPFDDVRVRQALSHAVNKDEILQTALGGVGKTAFAPLAPTLPGYDASLKQSELGYDPAKAKALLTAAGFTAGSDGTWTRDGQKLAATLVTSTRAPNDAIATVLQSELKAIGVPMDIKLLDSQAAMTAMTKGQYDLMLWRYDWNDADVLNVYLGTSRIGQTNRNFYSNPAVDKLLAQATSEMDATKRTALYVEAQKAILNDAPWQPLYVPVDNMAIRTRVQNLVLGPMGRTLFNDVTVTN
jgi:peptide/nickel transport system substrate-binding protein